MQRYRERTATALEAHRIRFTIPKMYNRLGKRYHSEDLVVLKVARDSLCPHTASCPSAEKKKEYPCVCTICNADLRDRAANSGPIQDLARVPV